MKQKVIGIDARMYGAQVKGLGIYTEQLIRQYSKLDHEFKFKIFLNKSGLEQFKYSSENIRAVELDIPWYGIREQLELPKELAKHQLDLMHFPHFNIPYTYKGRFVMTLHDLILLDYPSRRASKLSWPKYFIKHVAYRVNLRHSLQNAKDIITVSQYSRSRINHYFPFTKGRVHVTHLAPQSLTAIKSEDSVVDYGINKPYLLYVGNAYPHKNLEFLVKAFHEFHRSENGKDYILVLVGKLDYFYERLRELINDLRWPGTQINTPIRIFGYATERQLAKLYEKASLYVFPSLEEGFGIPPLEAMQYNLPVLASRRASMPEILGNAARYFDPTNQDDFIKQVLLLLNDSSLRSNMVQGGMDLLRGYDWQITAEKTLDVYRSALTR